MTYMRNCEGCGAPRLTGTFACEYCKLPVHFDAERYLEQTVADGEIHSLGWTDPRNIYGRLAS